MSKRHDKPDNSSWTDAEFKAQMPAPVRSYDAHALASMSLKKLARHIDNLHDFLRRCQKVQLSAKGRRRQDSALAQLKEAQAAYKARRQSQPTAVSLPSEAPAEDPVTFHPDEWERFSSPSPTDVPSSVVDTADDDVLVTTERLYKILAENNKQLVGQLMAAQGGDNGAQASQPATPSVFQRLSVQPSLNPPLSQRQLTVESLEQWANIRSRTMGTQLPEDPATLFTIQREGALSASAVATYLQTKSLLRYQSGADPVRFIANFVAMYQDALQPQHAVILFSECIDPESRNHIRTWQETYSQSVGTARTSTFPEVMLEFVRYNTDAQAPYKRFDAMLKCTFDPKKSFSQTMQRLESASGDFIASLQTSSSAGFDMDLLKICQVLRVLPECQAKASLLSLVFPVGKPHIGYTEFRHLFQSKFESFCSFVDKRKEPSQQNISRTALAKAQRWKRKASREAEKDDNPKKFKRSVDEKKPHVWCDYHKKLGNHTIDECEAKKKADKAFKKPKNV